MSGQIFAVRNNEIFLMGQSWPLRGIEEGAARAGDQGHFSVEGSDCFSALLECCPRNPSTPPGGEL